MYIYMKEQRINILNILMVFSVVLGVAACIGIVVSGMYENVKYIQCLMKEVNIISREFAGECNC